MMRSSEIRQLKQALVQDAAEAAHRPENAVWLEPELWVTYMGKKTRGALCASFSDEELLSILRETAGRLGRNPSKKEVFCVYRVFLIERFMRLKTSEAMAIRWHMGGFDDTAKSGGYAISNAFDKYPIAVKLHLADLESTYLREKGTSSVNRR